VFVKGLAPVQVGFLISGARDVISPAWCAHSC